MFTENVSDCLPLATEGLDRSEELFGLVLASDRSYPRGHPRTLGRAVLALDRHMAEYPEDQALRNRIDWLPVPENEHRDSLTLPHSACAFGRVERILTTW